MLLHVLVTHSFLFLGNVVLYRHCICLSIHRLMDICTVLSFGLLGTKYYEYAHTGLLFSLFLGVEFHFISRKRIAGFYGKCSLTLKTLINCFPKAASFAFPPAIYDNPSCSLSLSTLCIVSFKISALQVDV